MYVVWIENYPQDYYGSYDGFLRGETQFCCMAIDSDMCAARSWCASKAFHLPEGPYVCRLSLSAAWWKTISPLTAFDFSHNRIRRRNYFLVAVGSALLQNGCPTSFFSLVLFLPSNVLWPLFVNKILSVLILYSDTKNIIYIKFLCHQVKFT